MAIIERIHFNVQYTFSMHRCRLLSSQLCCAKLVTSPEWLYLPKPAPCTRLQPCQQTHRTSLLHLSLYHLHVQSMRTDTAFCSGVRRKPGKGHWCTTRQFTKCSQMDNQSGEMNNAAGLVRAVQWPLIAGRLQNGPCDLLDLFGLQTLLYSLLSLAHLL